MALSNDKRPYREGGGAYLPTSLAQNLSEAVSRRSRCGLVRGKPVLSSHLSPGLAPQVMQRTANACSFLTFMSA